MTHWSGLLARAKTRPVHATLIDPANTPASEAGKRAEELATLGTDLFLLGGSTDVTGEMVQSAVDAIHDACRVPVFLFPSSHTQVAAALDGILFTIPFNSTRREHIIEEQALGAFPVAVSGLEVVSTAYVIVEPGMTVGRVTRADLVARGQPGVERVERYAYLARVLRFDAIYLEAGSGAPDPVPPALIRAAAGAGVPVIAGGGIRAPADARAAVEAGARVVVTGTLAEKGDHDAVRRIIEALGGRGT